MKLKSIIVVLFLVALLWAALPATDAFTNTNGTALATHSASWTQNNGAMDIQTNSLHPNSAAGQSIAGWNADTFGNDQYAQITIAAITTGTYIGPAVRVATSNLTGYRCVAASNEVLLQLENGGSETGLGTYTATINVGDVIRLEISGTSLVCKVNGVSRITATNATLTSGRGGVSGYNNAVGVRADDWEASDLSAATGQGSVRRRIR